MQRYIGTKVIQAEPMERDGEPGYKVFYEDGYESWSPFDVFEKSYKPCDAMTFGKEGRKWQLLG